MIINLISGVDKKTQGIGARGGIPWNNKEDMKWFKTLTVGCACIMGWTTFISFKKPLVDRLNIVISPDLDATSHFDCDNSNVRNARSLEEAIKIAEAGGYSTTFVIGGRSIYEQYLTMDVIDSLYIDFIDNSDTELEFDTYFPFEAMKGYDENDDYWFYKVLGYSENNKNQYTVIHRIRTENNDTDYQYLNLLTDIKEFGQTKHTRAGETLSMFGKQLRFNAFTQLPCLTTKKMYTKGCIHELLWFIKGDTNIRYLVEHDCHIWDDDAYRHYRTVTGDCTLSKEDFIKGVCEGRKLTLPNGEFVYGDLGPIYGKQWTDWNGINQLDELIEKLKTNPDDRRLMISSWNVGELKNMSLPPCHYMSQWYVTRLTDEQKSDYEKTYGKTCPNYGLSVMWSQRSVDTCLGLPYDLLSYSVFLYLVAQCAGMAPLEVICNLGDTHIYKNQLLGVEEQLRRNPFRFEKPKLKLNENIHSIYDFTYDDIRITNYESYPSIKYPLSVGL